MRAPSPVLEELIRSQRVVGKTGKIFDQLPALSTENNLHIIQELMFHLKPDRTLEIGLSFGGSALAFSQAHKNLGREGAVQHVAIDPFQGRYWDDSGLLALERSGLSSYLDFRNSSSEIELPKFLSSGHRFGLIYVDGSHLFEHVFLDAFFSIRLLTDGGVVLFDDSSNSHVAKVVRFLRTNGEGLVEYDLSQWRKIRKPLKYAVARCLGKIQLTAFQRTGDVERNWDAPFHRF